MCVQEADSEGGRRRGGGGVAEGAEGAGGGEGEGFNLKPLDSKFHFIFIGNFG